MGNTLLLGLIPALISGTFFGLISGPGVGLLVGLGVGLFTGGTLKLARELDGGQIYLIDPEFDRRPHRWSWRAGWDSLWESRWNMLKLGALVGVGSGVAWGPAAGLYFGLLAALWLWVGHGLMDGMIPVPDEVLAAQRGTRAVRRRRPLVITIPPLAGALAGGVTGLHSGASVGLGVGL